MRPFFALTRMRLAALRNRFLDLHRDAVAKALVIIIGLGLICGLAYQVAYWSFRFIERFPAIGPPLNERLLALFFLILLVMVTLSTAVVVYATLFLAAETEFLFGLPMKPRLIFFGKLGESVAFSAWATLVLGLPVVLGFGHARAAGFLFYLEAGATLLLFLIFCGFIGATIMLLLLEVVRRWTWRRLALVGLVLVGIPAWLFLRSFDFGGLQGDENLQVLDRFTAGISAIRSPFFPAHWASAAVVASSSGHHREALFQGGILFANTLIFLPIFSAYGRYRYGRRWLLGRDPASARDRNSRANAQQSSVRFLSSPTGSLIWKDSLTFLRDPAQLSQFLLFLLLLLVYVMSLLRIPHELFGGTWKQVIYFANLGAISLVISSFTSRFLFPLPSLEGRCIWIVGLAPVPREFLVRQKALLGAMVILILGLSAAFSSSRFLGFQGWDLLTALYIITLEGWCLTALAAGLGAAYPNLSEDNPARIAVGLGGTLNFFASIAAILMILFIEGLPYILFRPPPAWAVFSAHGLALLFTVLVSGYALRLGRRALRAMEF